MAQLHRPRRNSAMEPVANRQLRNEPSGARPDGSFSLVGDTTPIDGDAVATVSESAVSQRSFGMPLCVEIAARTAGKRAGESI
jgi:hypothetical protein